MLSPTSRYQFRSTPPPPALVADEEPANDPAMDTEADESQLAQPQPHHLVFVVSFLVSFHGEVRWPANDMKVYLNSTRSTREAHQETFRVGNGEIQTDVHNTQSKPAMMILMTSLFME